MKLFRKRLINGSKKQDILWNMAGNLSSAAHSILMLAYVSRLCGVEDAGVFSLTYSAAQLMYLIACFQLVNVVVTDAQGRIGIQDAAFFRLCSNIIMIVCASLFARMQGFSGYKLQVYGLLILYMILLSIAELCECYFHRNGYLHLAGKSLSGNVLLNSAVFAIGLFLTKDLRAAAGLMCISTFFWILLFDLPYFREVYGLGRDKRKTTDGTAYLLRMCLPLVFMQFIMNYIINAPKFAINGMLTDNAQSYYGYVMMPAACVNLLNLFALKPQLINLTQALARNDGKRFCAIVTKLLMWNGAVSVCVLVGGFLLGVPILSVFYGVDLSGMEPVLCIVLTGGCFYAVAVMFDAVTTTLRCHKWNLLVYIPAFVLSLILPKHLITAMGLTGAAISYMALMMTLAAGSGMVMLLFLKRKWAK